MPNFLRAALFYAKELGWAVFPLKPGLKAPLTEHGLLDATTLPDQITEWWTKHPAANIGIATGEASDIVVVDVDGPQGEDALAAFGDLPRCPSSSTGKGRHLIFARPAAGLRNSAGKLGPQLDTRGDGGYIVAPPSVHPSGAVYRWLDGLDPRRVSPPPLPAAILSRLTDPLLSRGPLTLVTDGTPPTYRTAAEIPLAEQIPEGQRNTWLAEYVGRLLAKGLGELETLELAQAVNLAKCTPPLPASEVRSLVGSIAAAEHRQKLQRATAALASPAEKSASLLPIDRSVFDVLAERNQLPVDVVSTHLSAWNRVCRGFGGGKGLPRGWHVTIGGASGTGKSLFALNLAVSAIKSGAKVAYISLEMSIDQLLARLLAIHARCVVSELEPGDAYSTDVYDACVNQFLTTCEEGDSGVWIAERPASDLPTVCRQLQAACDAGCRLLIVDYLQLIYVPDTDGIAEQMRRASQALQSVAFGHNVTTVGLSQFNRATSFAKESPGINGLTGSSSIENDSDQVILLDHSSNKRTAMTMDTMILVAKNRHGPQAKIPVRWDYSTLTLSEREPSVDEQTEFRGIIPPRRTRMEQWAD